MDRSKFETQLLAGIKEDEDAGITQPDEDAKTRFKAMAEYQRGQYDEDESFEKLEEKMKEVEEKEMGGKGKADRVYYVSKPCLLGSCTGSSLFVIKGEGGGRCGDEGLGGGKHDGMDGGMRCIMPG